MNNTEKVKSKIGRAQNSIKDHRVNKSWHNLDSVLDGDMDKIIKLISEKLPK